MVIIVTIKVSLQLLWQNRFHIFWRGEFLFLGDRFWCAIFSRCDVRTMNITRWEEMERGNVDAMMSNFMLSWRKVFHLYYIGKVSAFSTHFPIAEGLSFNFLPKKKEERKKCYRKSWVNRKTFSLLAGLVN